jgi:uncharacterized protein with PQ loop repeat
MHLGHQHKMFNGKKPRTPLRSIFAVATLDTFAYVASFASIFFTLDQVRIIYFDHTAQGVSLISWLFYTFSSVIWYAYGRVHKERILIITNAAWFVINIAVVVGILMYGGY